MAGRLRRVLLELPGREDCSGVRTSLSLTFREEDAEKWMICLVHHAGQFPLQTVVVLIEKPSHVVGDRPSVVFNPEIILLIIYIQNHFSFISSPEN